MFLVDVMGYLTALARTDLDGHLNDNDRNIVEKLFQTYSMWIGRFTKPGAAVSTALGAVLIAYTHYTHYYNHLRGYQALDDQPPVEQLENSI